MTRYLMASFALRMPPQPSHDERPGDSGSRATASSITSATGSVAAGLTLPVEVLMSRRHPASEIAGAPDVWSYDELARLQDDHQVRLTTADLTAALSENRP